MPYRSLYFICPTDCLESVINLAFVNQNHFYTSLGNSVVFDAEMANVVKALVLKHHIKSIYFVLALNNIIVSDVLENQAVYPITDLKNTYAIHIDKKRPTQIPSQLRTHRSVLLSHHLNQKISGLQQILQTLGLDHIAVSGKIYDKDRDEFDKIYSALICTAYFALN